MVKDKDDDLIAWYTALAKGERYQALKDALRAGLELVVSTDVHRDGRTTPIGAEQFEALRQELYREWTTWIQQFVDGLPNYVQVSVEQAINGNLQPSDNIEGAPALSRTEVDQRKSKLKKAHW
jgi:hypothetical protein